MTHGSSGIQHFRGHTRSVGATCFASEKPICYWAALPRCLFVMIAPSCLLRFSQCDLCFHFKDALANAKNVEEKLGTLVEYRKHLAEQYQDRALLWSLQEASLDPMSDVLVCQLDGMDQSKYRLPRDPRLRCTASVTLVSYLMVLLKQ